MTDQPRLTVIAAVARNGVIGRGNRLPWHLPADLAHFKRVTMGKPVLMGRLTWESIGRPLPGRLNLVLTSSLTWRAEGATRVGSLEDALKEAAASGSQELMVIGGAHVYEQALPLARRIHLTKVHFEPWGDTLFPELDPHDWREVARQERMADEKNPYDLTFIGLERAR